MNPQSTEITRLEINGDMALRFEVSGYIRGGKKVTYLYTVLVGNEHLVVVNAWSQSIDYLQNKPLLETLSLNITGLS